MQGRRSLFISHIRLVHAGYLRVVSTLYFLYIIASLRRLVFSSPRQFARSLAEDTQNVFRVSRTFSRSRDSSVGFRSDSFSAKISERLYLFVAEKRNGSRVNDSVFRTNSD